MYKNGFYFIKFGDVEDFTVLILECATDQGAHKPYAERGHVEIKWSE